MRKELNKQLFRLDTRIQEVNDKLEQIREMIDFKIHCDYKNATGNELEAPWDNEKPLYLRDLGQDTLPCGAFLQMFLTYYCELEDQEVTYAADFAAAVQKLCREQGLRPYTALEIREEMEQLSKIAGFTCVIDHSYKYYGLKLLGDK